MTNRGASRLALSIVAVAGLSAALAVALSVPLTKTMPVYFELAARLQRGPVSSSFEPLGYPWLIAMIPGEALDGSAKILHLVCYALLIALLVNRGLKVLSQSFDGAGRHSSLCRSAIVVLCASIALNPYILANLSRLNDNNVAVLLVLALFALITPADDSWSDQSRLIGSVLAGCCLGVLTLVRPNAITLVPVLLFAFGRGRAGVAFSFARAVGPSLAAGGALLLTYASLATLASGAPGFWPGNGPYNAFAGNNPAAMKALIRDYNAEPSLPEGLAWCGVTEPSRLVSPRQYLECSERFVIERPADAVALSIAKLHNMLFRPNLRLADSPLKEIMQWSTLALPLLWWTANAIRLLRRRSLLDPAAALFVTFYALPFVFTNSDPRFRLPLDSVYALSLMQHVREIVPRAWRR